MTISQPSVRTSARNAGQHLPARLVDPPEDISVTAERLPRSAFDRAIETSILDRSRAINRSQFYPRAVSASRLIVSARSSRRKEETRRRRKREPASGRGGEGREYFMRSESERSAAPLEDALFVFPYAIRRLSRAVEKARKHTWITWPAPSLISHREITITRVCIAIDSDFLSHASLSGLRYLRDARATRRARRTTLACVRPRRRNIESLSRLSGYSWATHVCST